MDGYSSSDLLVMVWTKQQNVIAGVFSGLLRPRKPFSQVRVGVPRCLDTLNPWQQRDGPGPAVRGFGERLLSPGA